MIGSRARVERAAARARAARVLAWLALALLALGAWLSLPRAGGAFQGSRALRVLLADTSGSVRARWSAWRPRVRDALRAELDGAREADQDLLVVAFDGEVRRVYGPGPARDPAADEAVARLVGTDGGDPGATDLAGALALARDAIARHAGEAEVVVLGDRTYTGGDPRAALGELAALGAEVRWVELPPRDATEVVVTDLRAPERVEPGAPIVALVDLAIAPAMSGWEGRIRLDVDRATLGGDVGGVRREEVEVGFEPLDERGFFRRTVRIVEATARDRHERLHVGVSVAPGPPGTRRETSDALGSGRGAIVEVGQPKGLGAVVEDPYALDLTWNPARPLAEGLQVILSDAERVEAIPAGVDALIVDGVALERLPCALIDTFVRQGGGLLVLGPEPIAAEATGDALALQERLPLRPKGAGAPPRDVVFVLDGSGSMRAGGFDAALAALPAAVGAARADDALSLRVFAAELGAPVELVPLGDAAARARARAELASRLAGVRAPGGPTRLVGALEALARERAGTSREALAIVLSDGRETAEEQPLERAREVREALAAANARVVAIAATADADLELLAALAGDDVVVLALAREAGPPADALARVFARETSRGTRSRGEIALRAATPAAGTPAAEVAAATGALPPIEDAPGYELALGAEAAWTTADGEPVLALARHGVGLIAACSFAPDSGAAPRWRGRGDLYAPLVRLLARGARDGRTEARFEDGWLRVERLDDGAPASLAATLRVGDEAVLELALTPPTDGPAPLATRAGRLLPEDTAALDRALARAGPGAASALRVALRGDGWAGLELPLAPLPRPEHAFPRPRVADLDLPAAGGTGPARGRAPHPASLPVLAAGLAALAGAALLGRFSRA